MPSSTPASPLHEGVVLSRRIDAIALLIPDDFPNKEAMIRALRERQDSIQFTAPTAMVGRWFEVANILDAMLPDPASADWVGKIQELFSAEY